MFEWETSRRGCGEEMGGVSNSDSREVLTVGSQAVSDLVTTIPWAEVQAPSRLDSNGAQKLALLDLKSCLPPNVVC